MAKKNEPTKAEEKVVAAEESESTPESPEAITPAVTAEATAPAAAPTTEAKAEKSGEYTPQIIRVLGFRGQYFGVTFDNNGVSTTPVPVDVYNRLKADYPGAEIIDGGDIDLSIVADTAVALQGLDMKKGHIQALDESGKPFIGAYLDARFNEFGISEEPVGEATLSALTAQFPGLVIRTGE